MATIDVAMESSIQEVKTVADNIYSKVDTEIDSINSKIDIVDNIIDAINSATASSTSANASGTLSQKLTYIISTLIGATNNSGGTATAGTVMAKLNKIISSMGSSGGLNIKAGSVTGTGDYGLVYSIPSGVGFYQFNSTKGGNIYFKTTTSAQTVYGSTSDSYLDYVLFY